MRATLSRIARSLVPSTMGSRLVLTAALLAFTTTAVTLGVNAVLISARAEAWTRGDVAATVEGFRSFLAMEQQALDTPVEHIAGAPVFRSLYAASRTADLRRDYQIRLLEDTQADALVALDASGALLFSNGSDADLTVLRSLAGADAARETTGLVRLTNGVALVCGVPVLDGAGLAPVGRVVAARVIDPEQLQRFDSMLRTVKTSLHDPGYRPAGVTMHTLPAESGAVSYGESGLVVIATAELQAMNGGTAGVAELRDLDPRGATASSVATESALFAGASALLIGLGLGLWLAGIMRRPVARMIHQVRRRAEAASAGDQSLDAVPLSDPILPVEFQELADVIDDLVDRLGARRIELEGALRDAAYADRTLSVVVNESPEAKIVLQDDRVLIANPAAAKATGVKEADLVGRTVASALSGVEIRAEDGRTVTGPELVALGLEESTTVSFAPKEGEPRWYSVDAVRHSEDARDQVLLTARDVTEDRRIASIRGEIMSLVGHDLRTPLTVVIGYLDLMQRPMADEDLARAVASARRNAGRMADLLEDLQSATRAQELLAPSDLVPTSLTALAEEVVASLAPMHTERSLTLDADCEPIVLGEEKRLRQVLVNLVTNAFKYSPAAEPIEVRVRCDEKTAYLAVVDRGPGIPADERGHVFERFARLRGDEERPGMGLGLYIVSIIARNHGGTARVDETPGGGATFVVELPLTGTMVDGEFVV